MTHRLQSSRRRRHNANKPLALDPLPRLIGAVFNLDGTFTNQHLRKHILSKYNDPDPSKANIRRTAAIEKWLKCEERNAETNVRLRHLPWSFHILPGVTFRSFVTRTRSLIASVLRVDPELDHLFGGFSGGASTSRARTDSHPAEKYRGRADITELAEPLFNHIILAEGWFANSPCETRVVPGNVMFTVPKNSSIDRCACKEPDGNMYMQKGVGNYIRARLRKVGIDLNDQSINKRLAQLGSIDGQLCTVDLSAASDSVTVALCELLLPENWHTMLMMLRSPITIIDGKEHVNEMMSSMGNGFTFELESLLFWAITRSVCYFGGYRGVISVYGDDIIAPTSAFHDLRFVLDILGFTVNTDKSFYTGNFRESCGGHYYNGRDVTPFYVKAPIRTLIDLIHLGNQVRRWSCYSSDTLDLSDLWVWIKSQVPPHLWGGRDLNDKSALVTPEEPRKRLAEVQRKVRRHVGDYIFWLDGGRSEGSRKRSTGRYRLRPSGAVPWFSERLLFPELLAYVD